MGIETIAIAALTGISAASSISQGKKESKAIIREGEIAAKNKSMEVRRRASRATASFLSSGLTLDGTPQSAIGSIYNVGLQDITQIQANYNTQAKNVMSKARSEAIGKLMSAGSSLAMGSMGSMGSVGSYLPDSFAYGLNNMGFGSTAYDMLEQSDARFGLDYMN